MWIRPNFVTIYLALWKPRSDTSNSGIGAHKCDVTGLILQRLKQTFAKKKRGRLTKRFWGYCYVFPDSLSLQKYTTCQYNLSRKRFLGLTQHLYCYCADLIAMFLILSICFAQQTTITPGPPGTPIMPSPQGKTLFTFQFFIQISVLALSSDSIDGTFQSTGSTLFNHRIAKCSDH